MQSVTSRLVGVILVQEQGVSFERLQSPAEHRFTVQRAPRGVVRRRTAPVSPGPRVIQANMRQLHCDLTNLFSSIAELTSP